MLLLQSPLIETHHGDCLHVLRNMPDSSVHAIVTDPPYGINFMNKHWDYDIPSGEIWKECLRVLKPGGHLLAFAGTRTQHRMAVRIEDAGFEIRDMIMWVYGSGFPKSLDIGKAVDKLQGNERVVTGTSNGAGKLMEERPWNQNPDYDKNIPVTKGTSEYEGWGTALKPALEPITMARKPFKGNVATNVLKHGTGAINIDACRIAIDPVRDDMKREVYRGERNKDSAWAQNSGFKNETNKFTGVPPEGRFPANLIHDGSPEVVENFPSEAGAYAPVKAGHPGQSNGIYGDFEQKGDDGATFYNDTGSAARFFYCPKAQRQERDQGLHGAEKKFDTSRPWCTEKSDRGDIKTRLNSKSGQNHHPTVKPLELMQYLCRLVTPPGAIILDPFMGSGTTGMAAYYEGFRFIGIEIEEEYFHIANARITRATKAGRQTNLFQ